jgi:hypothetical protein
MHHTHFCTQIERRWARQLQCNFCNFEVWSWIKSSFGEPTRPLLETASMYEKEVQCIKADSGKREVDCTTRASQRIFSKWPGTSKINTNEHTRSANFWSRFVNDIRSFVTAKGRYVARTFLHILQRLTICLLINFFCHHFAGLCIWVRRKCTSQLA